MVIAIIGILSSVVLGSLGGARTKANVNGVKSTMKQIISQSSIYYDSHGNTYGVASDCVTDMFSDPVISRAVSYITTNATAPVCASIGEKWAISTTLKDGTFWCVDSAPTEKAGSADQASGTCI